MWINCGNGGFFGSWLAFWVAETKKLKIANEQIGEKRRK